MKLQVDPEESLTEEVQELRAELVSTRPGTDDSTLLAASPTAICRAIATADASAHFVRKAALGELLSFEAAAEQLATTQALCGVIAGRPLELIAPSDPYDRLLESLQALFRSLRAINRFSPDDGRPARDDRIEELKTAHRGVLQSFIPIAGYLVLTGDVGAELEARASQMTESISATAQAIRKEADDQASELTALVERAREAAASAERLRDTAAASSEDATISRFSRDFQDEAKSHGMFAIGWLVFAVVSIVALAFLSDLLIKRWPLGESLDDPETLQFLLLKGSIAGAGFILIVAALRMFRAERHLQVMNKHRYRALSTFQAFVENAREDPTRDAVLLETTRAIFAPGSTGLIGVDGDSGSSTTLLEILRPSPRQS